VAIQVAQFLGESLARVADRLLVIWGDSPVSERWLPFHLWNSTEEAFYQFVYRQCSLTKEYHLDGLQLANESKILILEAAREKIIFELTKSVADFIGPFLSLSLWFLAELALGTACLSRGYLAPSATELTKKPTKEQSADQDALEMNQQQADEKLVRL
jgi:hypothetical protein